METIKELKAKNIGEYFGTLLESVTQSHIGHLKVSNKRDHETLEEYYTESVDLVDAIIEHYQGIYGKVKDKFVNNIILHQENDPIKYFELLREFVILGSKEFFKEKDSELFGDVDDLLGLIDTILYKLKELSESTSTKTLKDFLVESFNK